MLVLLGDQHRVEAGQPLGLDFAPEFFGQFDLALVSELQGEAFARPNSNCNRLGMTRHWQNGVMRPAIPITD